jgi:hypothetical protein
MIESLIKNSKKIKDKSPRRDLNLSNIETEIADIDATIDALVFRLYRLSRDEIEMVLNIMGIERNFEKTISLILKNLH